MKHQKFTFFPSLPASNKPLYTNTTTRHGNLDIDLGRTWHMAHGHMDMGMWAVGIGIFNFNVNVQSPNGNGNGQWPMANGRSGCEYNAVAVYSDSALCTGH